MLFNRRGIAPDRPQTARVSLQGDGRRRAHFDTPPKQQILPTPDAGGGLKETAECSASHVPIGRTTMTKLLEQYRSTYSATADEEISLEDYLGLCKKDPTAYSSASERMLASIGEPELFDTRNDPRLSRIFSNRLIRRYPAFRESF